MYPQSSPSFKRNQSPIKLPRLALDSLIAEAGLELEIFLSQHPLPSTWKYKPMLPDSPKVNSLTIFNICTARKNTRFILLIWKLNSFSPTPKWAKQSLGQQHPWKKTNYINNTILHFVYKTAKFVSNWNIQS